MSFAKVEVYGNLGADPETKYTPNGAMVVEVRIAVNDWRKPDSPPTWYRVSFWDNLATRIDSLAQQGKLQRGYSLLVHGDLTPREYQANDGANRISFDVRATSFEFVGGGPRRDDAAQEEPNF